MMSYKHTTSKVIWASRCIPRIKFFTWLVFVDHLNTKTMLTRKHINMHDDELCVLCVTGDLETINHLFFNALLLSNAGAKFSFTGI
jgi:hypothetical protein